MAQAVEAPSALDGMADDERRQNFFRFCPCLYLLQMEVATGSYQVLREVCAPRPLRAQGPV